MCGRCVFTTVNPHDGSRDSNGEPLKTLKTFRFDYEFYRYSITIYTTASFLESVLIKIFRCSLTGDAKPNVK